MKNEEDTFDFILKEAGLPLFQEAMTQILSNSVKGSQSDTFSRPSTYRRRSDIDQELSQPHSASDMPISIEEK